MDIKLDILVLAAHPDDAELGCGGTIARHVALGHKVGVIDFTRGELGTRGTVQTRDAEAAWQSGIVLGSAIVGQMEQVCAVERMRRPLR